MQYECEYVFNMIKLSNNVILSKVCFSSSNCEDKYCLHCVSIFQYSSRLSQIPFPMNMEGGREDGDLSSYDECSHFLVCENCEGPCIAL